MTQCKPSCKYREVKPYPQAFCNNCNAQHEDFLKQNPAKHVEKQGKDSPLEVKGLTNDIPPISNGSSKMSQPALCKCGHNHISYIGDYEPEKEGWTKINECERCKCEKFEVKNELFM